jgi:mono/diheme cytochrome c family protein
LHRHARPLAALAGIALAAWLAACGPNMYDQPRHEPEEQSDFFPDGQASRPRVPDTVARGRARTDDYYYTGKVDGTPVAAFPTPVTKAMIERGHERYDIYCSVCHGLTGYGDGMIVQRGFPHPPSFHTEALRNAPIGHFYDVITNGYGVMYPYASRVSPDDRWAIAAYIRALQLSQDARPGDVPPAQLPGLGGGTP